MKNKWTLNNIPDLSGKIIIVTGANSGLGYESVKAFAQKGAEVILASRSIEKGENAKAKILASPVKGKVSVMQVDISDLESIKTFVQNFKTKYSKLDILLNNAGIMAVPYGVTTNGFESQMGTNHLGHYALTGQLLDLIAATPNSRVVNVSSMAHKQGSINFDNFMFEGGKKYKTMKAYGNSKLANLLFTYELQKFFESNYINSISVAAHPGVSHTNLASHMQNTLAFKIIYPLFKLITQNPENGALPQLRACTDESVKGGEYYGPGGFAEFKGFPVKVKSTKASHSLPDAKKLWDLSAELTGVKFHL